MKPQFRELVKELTKEKWRIENLPNHDPGYLAGFKAAGIIVLRYSRGLPTSEVKSV